METTNRFIIDQGNRAHSVETLPAYPPPVVEGVRKVVRLALPVLKEGRQA